MAWRYWHNDVLPFTVMVAGECTGVGLFTLFKAATLKGMSYSLFIVYSYAIGSLILLPLSFMHRSEPLCPSLKRPVIFRVCLLGLVGFLAQVSGYKGLEYGSPTLASVMSNLTPAFTFILAIIFRMEKIALSSIGTRAKIIGSMVSISGSLVVVLYRGPAIVSVSSPILPVPLQQPLSSPQSNWVIGGLLLAARFILIATWYIIQTQIMKMYPAELTIAFFYNLGVTICSTLGCLIGGTTTWNVGSEVAVVAVIYSGIFGSCFSSVIHTWGLRLKGPVYVALFKPLSIAIAAIMGFIFLGDALHLGSVVGAVIISIGFYAVIWGKAKEQDSTQEDCGHCSFACSSHDRIPLLQSHKTEEM